MEKVLEIYKRPYDPRFPVVCMDESPKQLIGETKTPIIAEPGRPAKYDYEYKRHGVCNIFTVMSGLKIAVKNISRYLPLKAFFP